MIARYSGSLASASLITLALLYLMQQMIAMGRPVLGETQRFEFRDWFIVERQPPEIIERDRITPPEPVVEPPSIERLTDRFTGDEITVLAIEPTPPTIGHAGPARSLMTDGDLLPIVKVMPNYPIRALTDGIEGQVLVEFTVTPSGGVSDVVVVESSHRMFERAAIEAASKFRYRPRVIDGEPVAVHGVRNLITFDLED